MISIKELEHLEVLSRIRITKEKSEEYLKKLSGIVDYIGKLGAVNSENIIPTSQVTNLENVLRDDVVTPSLTQEEATMNSKHAYKGYFKIPKVVE